MFVANLKIVTRLGIWRLQAVSDLTDRMIKDALVTERQ